jgi:CheY-like chemotaxis protein
MEFLQKSSLPNLLAGTRILVADDELMIALDVGSSLAEAGAEILGPCTTVAQALEVAEGQQLSAALLDISLGRNTTETIALALHSRGIPFAFYSGQDLPDVMKSQWPDSNVISKPARDETLIQALSDLLAAKRDQSGAGD